MLLTHLHSDHIVGLPELWITPWFMAGRKGKTRVHGPVGTRAMLEGMSQFLGSDVRQRANGFNRAEDLGWEALEFAGAGVVFASGGRKLVLSGDCTLSEGLIAAGQGADVVVHNVYASTPELLARDANKRVVARKLASPEQAGRCFAGRDAVRGVQPRDPAGLDEGGCGAADADGGISGKAGGGEDLMRILIRDGVEVG